MLVVFDPTRANVTVTVDGSEWSSTVNRVIVERDSGSGWVQVRGGARDVLGGFLVITDQEMPLHTTVQYRVRGYNGAAGIATLYGSVSTVVSGPKAFIKKASDPNAACAVTIILGALPVSSATQGGTYEVLNGGAVAVAAWSGVNADRFTLPVRTYTLQERQALEALLETRVLLFQSCADEPFRSGWYFVESMQRSLRGGGQILEGAEYSLSLIATGVPSGDTAGVSGASYAQVASIYTLYSDLTGTYFDALQVA